RPAARKRTDGNCAPPSEIDDGGAHDCSGNAWPGRRGNRRGAARRARAAMIVLSGAALVLPDRILSPGTLVIDNGRIAEVRSDQPGGSAQSSFAVPGHYIVPGFIDDHVHRAGG